MKLHEITKDRKDKSAKRVGRGIAAGGGKTAGRGTKGQKSRSGHNIPRKFEGGQTPLVMRLHKLPGFKSHKPKAVVVSLDDISKNYKNGEKVSVDTLIEKGLIRKGDKVKILGTGELTVKITLDDVSASKSAVDAISKASAKTEKTEKIEKSEETKPVEEKPAKESK